MVTLALGHRLFAVMRSLVGRTPTWFPMSSLVELLESGKSLFGGKLDEPLNVWGSLISNFELVNKVIVLPFFHTFVIPPSGIIDGKTPIMSGELS